MNLKLSYRATLQTVKPILANAFFVLVALSSVCAVVVTGLHICHALFDWNNTRPWFNLCYIVLFYWTYVLAIEFKEQWKENYRQEWRDKLKNTTSDFLISHCNEPEKHRLYHVSGTKCPCHSRRGK